MKDIFVYRLANVAVTNGIAWLDFLRLAAVDIEKNGDHEAVSQARTSDGRADADDVKAGANESTDGKVSGRIEIDLGQSKSIQ